LAFQLIVLIYNLAVRECKRKDEFDHESGWEEFRTISDACISVEAPKRYGILWLVLLEDFVHFN
jgi:hypothetical protein